MKMGGYDFESFAFYKSDFIRLETHNSFWTVHTVKALNILLRDLLAGYTSPLSNVFLLVLRRILVFQVRVKRQ